MNRTIVISCAGMGKRLGMDTPKCLVEINGMSLLERLLFQLKDEDDIRIVVGYKKEHVIEKVKKINPNVKIYENKNYKNTGTAGSFWCAIDDTVQELVISMVGDLLINSDDIKALLNDNDEFICGGKINTLSPIFFSLDKDEKVINISRNYGIYEWAGLVQIRREHLIKEKENIYQMVKPLLPLKFKCVRFKEIDTVSDVQDAREWLKIND